MQVCVMLATCVIALCLISHEATSTIPPMPNLVQEGLLFSKGGKEMTLTLFALGVAMLFVALYLYNAAKRASMMSREPTYSKSVNRAILDVGIYTEHGMVFDESGHKVKADCKKSRTYYESFV